jgi:hypothetical protein
MRKANSNPLDDLIQEALDSLMAADLAQFASNVETARAMLRKFPEFVTAPEFPEDLRNAFVQEQGREPDDAGDLGEDVLDPSHRESRLPDAIEIAQSWAARGRLPIIRLSPDVAALHDAQFLSDLGISLDDPGASDG